MKAMEAPARRVAVVTGGSRGIGRAVCIRLAKAGYDIALNYAGNAAAAEETAGVCREAGAAVLTVQADVSDPAGCDALIDAVKAQFGRVDVLVNNAGVTRDCLLMRLTEEDYDKVLDTNLKGAVFCCKAVSRLMMKQRYGRIINMSSVVGLRGNAGQVNYSASKAGLIGLTKSLAKELASRGVTVNAVAPGFVGTEMTDAMRKPPRPPPWLPSPPAASPTRTRSPARWSSSPPRAAATSPARSCAWTAAWRCEKNGTDRRLCRLTVRSCACCILFRADAPIGLLCSRQGAGGKDLPRRQKNFLLPGFRSFTEQEEYRLWKNAESWSPASAR